MSARALSVPVPSERRGRAVVLRAGEAAWRSGATAVAPRHLLAAALDGIRPSSPVGTALHRHAVDPAAVRAAVGSGGTARVDPAAPADDILCTSEALRVLARADLHAHRGRAGAVRAEHVLLACLDAADEPAFGVAHELLEDSGVDVRRLQRTVRRAAAR